MNAFNQVDSVFEYCLVLSQLIPQEHSRSIFQGKMIIPLVWRLTALDNNTTRLDLQYMAYWLDQLSSCTQHWVKLSASDQVHLVIVWDDLLRKTVNSLIAR